MHDQLFISDNNYVSEKLRTDCLNISEAQRETT